MTKFVTGIERQSLMDIINQEYGTLTAMFEVINTNNITDITPDLKDTTLKVNPQSKLVNQRRVKALKGAEIATKII